MSNAATPRDVVNEVARRQAASTTDVTHRALAQIFTASADPRASASFDELVDSMIPTLLTCRHADSTYDLTPEGWLESDLRSVVERVVDAYVRSYRGASPDVVGRLTITGKDLAASGAGDAEPALVWSVGRAFYLYQSSAFQKELDRLSFEAPFDVDELIRLQSCAEVCDYRRSRPRERVEFVNAALHSVTREVRVLRDAVWSAFKTRDEWPKTRELDVELSAKGLAVERIVESDLFIAGITVSLSLRGLWLTPGTDAEQDRVMRVLGALGDLYVRQHDATSVRAAELHSARADVSEVDARWVWRFLRHNMQFHVGTDADVAAFVLVPDLLAFRDASSFEHALFKLSRREKPRATRARGMQLIPGLPVWHSGDESDVRDADGAVTHSTVPTRAEDPTRFDVGELLGEGVYAEVYRATDTKLHRNVALKFVRPDVAGNNALEHARALARVQHPNIVVVYEVTNVAHPETQVVMPVVVMELVDGIDLAERIGAPIERRELRRIGIALIDAIEAYHANKLAHLDLWDHNVRVGDSVVKILDAIYFNTAALSSTATRTTQQAKDVRSVRDIIEQMLYSGGVSTEVAAKFIHATTRRDLTLTALRAAFDAAVPQPKQAAVRTVDVELLAVVVGNCDEQGDHCSAKDEPGAVHTLEVGPTHHHVNVCKACLDEAVAVGRWRLGH